jgi:hypothetical protein
MYSGTVRLGNKQRRALDVCNNDIAAVHKKRIFKQVVRDSGVPTARQLFCGGKFSWTK